MTGILIDTDILMDFFLDRKPFSDSSAKVLSLCENEEITGYITPVIYSNLYYLLRRLSDHVTVISKLRLLFSITKILIIDHQAVFAALNAENMKDFEDALQYYAAERSGNVKIIVTRNVRDYRKMAIAALTPDDFLKLNQI